jgi:hypothetical protein
MAAMNQIRNPAIVLAVLYAVFLAAFFLRSPSRAIMGL